MKQPQQNIFLLLRNTRLSKNGETAGSNVGKNLTFLPFVIEKMLNSRFIDETADKLLTAMKVSVTSSALRPRKRISISNNSA